MSPRAPRFDGVALALHQGWFTAVAEEMGATLMRSAHSPNITERLDHSCAVFDGDARLVAQAAHIPVHLGSMPRAVEAALTLAPFAPGDVVLLNDPFAGGTHLPDLTCVSPVFLGHRRVPDFFVASRAHHADVGGAAPGSLPIAREVFEEGFRIPPVRLMRAGTMVSEVLELLLANVRTPNERRADLAAQLGAQHTGEKRLRALAERSSGPLLTAAARALLDATERRTRAAIRELPTGTWSFTDVLDGDGVTDAPVPLSLTLTLRNGRARFDWTRSAPQTRGPVNAVRAVVTAASMYALRCVLEDDVAVNDGLLRCVEVVTRPGSVLDPFPPAAVGAGNVETSQRLVDVAFGALAKALPGRVPAASSGTMNNLLIGGVDPRTGRPFAYYETLGGGHGAGPRAAGESAMQAHMTNTRNTPIESLEHAYPLHVVRTSIRRGSGGAGRRRGGEGIERVLEMGADVRVTVISERRARGPWGLAGGAAGKPGRTTVRWQSSDARDNTLPAKVTIDLREGAVLTLASPGGGGHGTSLPSVSKRRRARS